MKFELEEYHRGISDEELITDLKRVALALNKPTIRRLDYDEKGKYGTKGIGAERKEIQILPPVYGRFL